MHCKSRGVCWRCPPPSCLLRITIQTDVLSETLAVLGAKTRWTSCSIFNTQNHEAAAIAKAGTSTVYAWDGVTLPEFGGAEEMITVPGAEG